MLLTLRLTKRYKLKSSTAKVSKLEEVSLIWNISKLKYLKVEISQSWNISKLKYLIVGKKAQGFLMSGEQLLIGFHCFHTIFHRLKIRPRPTWESNNHLSTLSNTGWFCAQKRGNTCHRNVDTSPRWISFQESVGQSAILRLPLFILNIFNRDKRESWKSNSQQSLENSGQF